MAFRAAQLQALKDPSVQEVQYALINAKIAAMKQQNPRTE